MAGRDQRSAPVESLSQKKQKASMRQMQDALEEQLIGLEPMYESYVRIHRALYGVDPDVSEVPHQQGEG